MIGPFKIPLGPLSILDKSLLLIKSELQINFYYLDSWKINLEDETKKKNIRNQQLTEKNASKVEI